MGILGGRADKLGNDYEYSFGVWLLLQVLLGDELSVTVEANGLDEKGVEYWVSSQNGNRCAYQCKRQNSSYGNSTISRLENENVISNAFF